MISFGQSIKDNFSTISHNTDTLFRLIKGGKTNEFINYISENPRENFNVNLRDSTSNYLIHFAIIINNPTIVTKLIDYGARLDFLDADGKSIMYYPIRFNYPEIVDILIEANKKQIGISLVNIKDAKRLPPLIYAVRYHNYHAMGRLLESGADADYVDYNASYGKNSNTSILQKAVIAEDYKSVEIIVDYVKDINYRSEVGSTALMIAVGRDKTNIVELLISKHADTTIPDVAAGMLPIQFAIVNHNQSMFNLLFPFLTNINYQDFKGATIMHYAIKNKMKEMISIIFNKYEIYKEVRNYLMKSPIINELDTTLVNIHGETILHSFLDNYHKSYDIYIRKIMPYTSMNSQDEEGDTPLHLLVSLNIWEDYYDILVLKKLDIYIRNHNDETALNLVISSRQSRKKFLDLVSRSYLNYLKKYESGWLQDWQNKCSTTEIDDKKCLKQINESIIDEKKSIPLKKMLKIITIDLYDTVNFSTYTTTPLDGFVGFKYLSLKYPEATDMLKYYYRDTSVSKKEKVEFVTKVFGMSEDSEIFIDKRYGEVTWMMQTLYFPPDFDKIFISLAKSKKYKYIIIPFGIVGYFGPHSEPGGHANGIFVNIEKQIIERFEPHGSHFEGNFYVNPELLDSLLEKRFQKVFAKINDDKITYLGPKDYLPRVGFQAYEGVEEHNDNIGDVDGFCQIWTIWYLDNRIRYADYDAKFLVRTLLKEIRLSDKPFRNIIRDYTFNITKLRDNYLHEIGKNINDYRNNKIKLSDKEKLVKIILN